MLEGWQTREEALSRYAGFSDAHERAFRVLLFFQRLVPRIPVRLLKPAFRFYKTQLLINQTFDAYLRIAPPDFVAAGLADDQEGAAQEQRDPDHPLRAERDFVKAE